MYLCICTLVKSRPTKKKLLDHVIPNATSRWYVLGVKLLKEDQESHLDVLRLNHAGNNEACCMEMFWYWLNCNTDATWEKLIVELRSSAVKLPVVANDLEKMLTGSLQFYYQLQLLFYSYS